MSKINLRGLADEEAKTELRNYIKNRVKNGLNSWGNDDPYTDINRVLKRFSVDTDKAIELLKSLKATKASWTQFLEI